MTFEKYLAGVANQDNLEKFFSSVTFGLANKAPSSPAQSSLTGTMILSHSVTSFTVSLSVISLHPCYLNIVKKFTQIYDNTELKFTFLYDPACRNYILLAILLQGGTQSIAPIPFLSLDSAI